MHRNQLRCVLSAFWSRASIVERLTFGSGKRCGKRVIHAEVFYSWESRASGYCGSGSSAVNEMTLGQIDELGRLQTVHTRGRVQLLYGSQTSWEWWWLGKWIQVAATRPCLWSSMQCHQTWTRSVWTALSASGQRKWGLLGVALILEKYDATRRGHHGKGCNGFMGKFWRGVREHRECRRTLRVHETQVAGRVHLGSPSQDSGGRSLAHEGDAASRVCGVRGNCCIAAMISAEACTEVNSERWLAEACTEVNSEQWFRARQRFFELMHQGARGLLIWIVQGLAASSLAWFCRWTILFWAGGVDVTR